MRKRAEEKTRAPVEVQKATKATKPAEEKAELEVPVRAELEGMNVKALRERAAQVGCSGKTLTV